MTAPALEVIPSRSGPPTLKLGDRLLHSAYDPVKEAERELDAIASDRPSLIVILGMGLGYAVRAARRRFPEVKILAVEAEPEIYALADRVARDRGEPLPNDESVTYVVGRNREANFAAITFGAGEREIACIRYVTRLAETDAAHYKEIVDTIGRVAAMHVEGLKSTAHFGFLWWENSVRNYREWATLPDVSGWFGTHRGRPAVIFAAGPTLMDGLDLFDAPGALRFVVDTALRTVASSGIRIDAVFAIDAQEGTLDHFTAVLPRRLVAAPVVPPRLWAMSDERILMSLAGPHFDWFDDALGRPVARLKSGGSVTTFAFDLARRMGADPIFLVGADFAHRGGRRHADGTAYETSEVTALSRFRSRERRLPSESAVVRDGLETEQNLAQYAQWMAWEIQATPARVYRAADFGLLKDVPVMDRGAIRKMLDAEEPRMASAAPPGGATDPRRLLEAFKTERIALKAALAGDIGAFRVLSGFFDPIIRPAAVASAREALEGELLDRVMEQLRRADAVLEEILA